jgi:hypothetical protein
MSLDLRIAKSVSCQGKTFNFSRAATPDGAVSKEPPLAAAKTGQLTTRTNNTAGVLTLALGHGFANTNIADIYWTDGGGGVAYKATLSAVNTTSATFSAAGVATAVGGGDVLPAVNTTITAMLPQSETFPVVATALQALACYAGGVPMVARFLDAGAADVAVVTVVPGNEGYVWFTADDAGSANPFGSTNTATVLLSHGSSAGTVAPSAYAYVD